MKQEEIIRDLQQIEDDLHIYNSKIVTLRFLGIRQLPIKKDVEFLNDFLKKQIKAIKKVRESLE